MIKVKYYYKDGTILDYLRWGGVVHREDGPAIEYTNGTKYWLMDNKRHRVDGPAVEWCDGTKYWFINGEPLTEEDFNNHPLVIELKFQKALEEEFLSGWYKIPL